MQLVGFSNSFASGEIAPDAWERTDLQQSQTGCEEALNFLGAVTGPNFSRGGMYRTGAPKFGDRKVKYFRWLRADAEGLVLEVGHLYARVWTARGAPLLTGVTPVEFAHGYSEDDLPGLRLQQIGDIAIVTSRDGLRMSRWSRHADDNWAASLYPLVNGPWLSLNTDPARTLTIISNGVDFDVEASFPLFEPGHVGASFLLYPPGGQPGLRSWAPNTPFNMGEYVLSAGRVYSNETATTNSGSTVPIHDRDAVSDGAIEWKFRHDGAGYIIITAVADATHATAAAPSETPIAFPGPSVVKDWQEAAFSNARGWPTAQAAVREERLCLAGARSLPHMVHMTRTAGFNLEGADFKPGLGTGLVVDDDAVSVGVGSTRSRIVSLVDAQGLLALTTDAEYVISGATVDDPIAPSAATPRRISSLGSADVEPVLVQGPPSVVIHVARGGVTLREIQLGADRSAAGRDLSILAQHIFGLGVKEMTWSRPDNNLWLILSDGTLAALTYHIEHGILGARRQPMAGGWLAESLATTPDPDGRDRLHVSAYRHKSGVTQRAHFLLTERRERFFMDCGGAYVGPPTLTIGGLAHLEGEMVAIIADGAQIPDRVVSAGQVTLDAAATEVRVGLHMLRRFKSLPLDPQGTGSMLGRKARATQGYVVLECVEAEVGCEVQDEPEDVRPFERISTRRPGDALPVARRRREKVTFGSGADRDCRIVVQTDAPFDLVIYALRPVFDAEA